MKITRQQLRRLIREMIGDDGDNVIPFPVKKRSDKLSDMNLTGGLEADDRFAPPDMAINTLSVSDISEMIDKQLGHLVYIKGDVTYRDDFLATLTGLSKTLRGDAIKAYLTNVSHEIRKNTTRGNVIQHPSVLQNELIDLADLLESFFITLWKDHLQVSQGMGEDDVNLSYAATMVVEQLESLGYKITV